MFWVIRHTAVGVVLAMSGVQAACGGDIDADWIYDWVEIAPGTGEIGVVDLPAPYADNLRALVIKIKRQESVGFDQKALRGRPSLHIGFYNKGKFVREFKIYRDPVLVLKENGRFYQLSEGPYADVKQLIGKLVWHTEALKKAIDKGNPLQRVRAAKVLLQAKKERSIALEVLRLAILNDDKAAAEEAITCCADLGIEDQSVLAAVYLALKDDSLRRRALLAIKSIGSSANACAPSLLDLYKKTKSKVEQRLILNTLASVDPMAAESRDLFLSCLIDCKADVEIRIAAVRGIGLPEWLASDDLLLLEKIIADTKNQEGSRLMHFVAVGAVFRIRPDHKELVGWLSGLLTHQVAKNNPDSTTIVRESIDMLGKIGPRAASALPVIRSHRGDSGDARFGRVVEGAIRRIESP